MCQQIKKWGICFLTLSASLTVPYGNSQNIIVNGDFENNAPTNNGNNIGWSISPWILGPGNRSNVVQVDGPGGFNYANRGPQSDASNDGQGRGAGVAQHYLDITDGANDFYQPFTVPQCGSASGQTKAVYFSGFFSTRGDRSGNGGITIRRGDGFSGEVLGRQTVSLPVPPNGSALEPWSKVEGQLSVAAGEKLSIIVSMDDNVNFDEGVLTFESGSCKSSLLTLNQRWLAGTRNDSSTITISRNGVDIDSLKSTVSNSNDQTTTDDSPVTVFQGEVLDLKDVLAAANAGNYQTTLSCTGATVNNNKVTINNNGDPVNCTFTSSAKKAELAINKSNQKDQVPQGQPFDYQIDASNAGPSAADKAMISDPKVDGLDCQSISCSTTKGAAKCPDNLTVDKFQSGIPMGDFPANSSVRFLLRCIAR